MVEDYIYTLIHTYTQRRERQTAESSTLWKKTPVDQDVFQLCQTKKETKSTTTLLTTTRNIFIARFTFSLRAQSSLYAALAAIFGERVGALPGAPSFAPATFYRTVTPLPPLAVISMNCSNKECCKFIMLSVRSHACLKRIWTCHMEFAVTV